MARTPALLLVLGLLSAGIPATARAEDPPAAAKPADSGASAPTGAPAAAQPATKAADAIVGEVITLPFNRTAAYGPGVVRGPNVNLTDSGNGEWKGNIKDLNGVFTVTEKRISGANLNMVMDRDPDEWTCQGTVDGKRVRIVMSKDGLTARYDNRLYDLKRVAPDLWATVPTGPALRVKGDAAAANPYYPQFILALLAVL